MRLRNVSNENNEMNEDDSEMGRGNKVFLKMNGNENMPNGMAGCEPCLVASMRPTVCTSHITLERMCCALLPQDNALLPIRRASPSKINVCGSYLSYMNLSHEIVWLLWTLSKCRQFRFYTESTKWVRRTSCAFALLSVHRRRTMPMRQATTGNQLLTINFDWDVVHGSRSRGCEDAKILIR